jgi:hypothetical protein
MSWINVLTVPLIYSLALPFVLLDLWVTLYQSVCFPVYGVARVPRRDYFAFDRARLPYLALGDKLNCAFCTYANGVLAYAREIAARTEQYWCPIKHARRITSPHEHYRRFLHYGDAAGYRREWPRLRARLAPHASVTLRRARASVRRSAA